MHRPDFRLSENCVYINLDRSTERRADIVQQFAQRGITCQRFPAVEGASLDDITCARLNPDKPGIRKLMKNEIGCFLSHRAIWTALIESDRTHVAVFEDDIILSSDAADFLTDFAWIDPAHDWIKLDHTAWPVLMSHHTSVANNRRLSQLHSKTVCTAGYIINTAAARHMIAQTDIMVAPVDIVMYDPIYQKRSHPQIWQINPTLCIQRPPTANQSTIDPSETRYKIQDRQSWTYVKAKMKREFLRPFKQLKTLVKSVVLFVTHQATWQRITYKE